MKQKEKVKQMLEDSDTEFYSNLVMENSGNSKRLFNTLNKMLRKKNESQLPPHDSALQLADEFMEYFIAKIEKIQDFIDQTIAANGKFKTPMSAFSMLSEANVSDLIIKSPATFCDLDPVPTWILGRCQEIIVKIMTQIINKSLRSAVMPEDFKLALLIPLLKNVGLEVIKPNFRPVSNLPYASKMIERAVANQMVEHMKQNDLFEPLQSAYKEGHSTETALLKVQNDLLVAMDNQRVSILVLLDLSAAFDTVNHRLLLKRLNDRCGVVRDALKWFESYLTDRSQTVKVKNVISKKMTLSCAVPQGSVLGPLLFLAYTLPLGDIMRKKGLQFHIYADDTQIYMSFTPNIDGISFSISRIEECIKDIEAWMMINRLKLNGDKTEMLIIGTNKNKQCRKLSNISITVGGSVIEASEKARNLGAVFDTNLTLKSHVSVVCKAARYHLHNISLARRFLTKEAAEKAIHAFVMSRLDCNNSLLYGLPSRELQKLQKVQNAAARILKGERKRCHITPVLKQLHWLPITSRIQYKIHLLTFKCLKDLAPKYLKELLKLRKAFRCTRSACDDLLLDVGKTRLATDGDRAFVNVAPFLWNRLPYSVRACTTVETLNLV